MMRSDGRVDCVCPWMLIWSRFKPVHHLGFRCPNCCHLSVAYQSASTKFSRQSVREGRWRGHVSIHLKHLSDLGKAHQRSHSLSSFTDTHTLWSRITLPGRCTMPWWSRVWKYWTWHLLIPASFSDVIGHVVTLRRRRKKKGWFYLPINLSAKCNWLCKVGRTQAENTPVCTGSQKHYSVSHKTAQVLCSDCFNTASSEVVWHHEQQAWCLILLTHEPPPPIPTSLRVTEQQCAGITHWLRSQGPCLCPEPNSRPPLKWRHSGFSRSSDLTSFVYAFYHLNVPLPFLIPLFWLRHFASCHPEISRHLCLPSCVLSALLKWWVFFEFVVVFTLVQLSNKSVPGRSSSWP